MALGALAPPHQTALQEENDAHVATNNRDNE
jgi:hypothetical protein